MTIERVSPKRAHAGVFKHHLARINLLKSSLEERMSWMLAAVQVTVLVYYANKRER